MFERFGLMAGLALGGALVPARASEALSESSTFERLADFSFQPDAPAAETPAAPPPPKGWLEGWKGDIGLGLNGSEGNTDRISGRATVSGQRLTDKFDTRFGLTYVYASTNGDKTEHRFRGELRNDWLLKGKWRLFAQGAIDVDEFQDWEWRASAYGGVGYEFYKTDKTSLLGRAGLGVSQEFGGSDDDADFEAILGLDYFLQVTERQKFTLTGELYPSLSDGGEFRALARAGYEILVDPEVNMTLKLGVEDRYDSDPGPGVRENDLDYFLLLVWTW
jgi:putative salt-induced outer membrane protein YdiY